MRGDEKYAAFHFEKCPESFFPPSLPPSVYPSLSLFLSSGDDLRMIKFAGGAL